MLSIEVGEHSLSRQIQDMEVNANQLRAKLDIVVER